MLNLFRNVRGVKIFMSEKKDGNMKLFSSDFDKNRKIFLEKQGLNYENLVSAELEHGANIEIIKNCRQEFIGWSDGLLTKNPEIILSVTSADCMPVFLFDKKEKVVGMLHCGWRSVEKGIIENGLEKMLTNFKSNPKNILFGIGPGIQKCHFEIGDDLIEKFTDYDKFVIKKGDKKFIDLASIIKDKLEKSGVVAKNIEVDRRCTFCDKNLWSYRRDCEDENGDVQAMIAGIVLD